MLPSLMNLGECNILISSVLNLWECDKLMLTEMIKEKEKVITNINADVETVFLLYYFFEEVRCVKAVLYIMDKLSWNQTFG